MTAIAKIDYSQEHAARQIVFQFIELITTHLIMIKMRLVCARLSPLCCSFRRHLVLLAPGCLCDNASHWNRWRSLPPSNSNRSPMEKFSIQNEFGQRQELLGEELVVPGFEEFQFILHAWLYDRNGGWAVTERSLGKRITSGPAGTEPEAALQLEQQLHIHGKDALLRVLGKGRLSS